jgi:hypothetical protein
VLAVADACRGAQALADHRALFDAEGGIGPQQPGPMLAQVKAGTRLFGNKDAAASRGRSSSWRGGLVVEAYAYLPSLEQARKMETGS